MPIFVVFHEKIVGWSRHVYEAENENEALRMNLAHHFRWLKGHDYILTREGRRYSLTYNGEGRPIPGGFMKKGGHWFSIEMHIGQEDDCSKCAGTGINHLDPFRQCMVCGNFRLRGKGTGKIKPKRISLELDNA